MIVIHDLSSVIDDTDSVVTIGAFDGVHLGHQALIRQVVSRARALPGRAVLITFHPHPMEVLTGRQSSIYLTTPEERAPLVEALGVDLMVVLQFTRQLANTSAAEFLEKVYDGLHLRELCVGPSFALGRGREGDISTLQQLGRVMGFEVRLVEPMADGGETITSSRIRQLVLTGQVRDAARLLGRFYSVTGRVLHGDHRGRTLGFPTANLTIPAQRIMPPDGVYAGFAQANDRRYGAVLSWGVRPTFGDHEHLLEAHLFDFDGDLYGTDLALEFVEWLRPEATFDDAEALVAQMHQDVAHAKEILANEARAR